MAFLNDNTLDNGLAALKSAADRIYICSSEPATYTAATSTVALGNAQPGAGSVFPSSIAAGSPSGRKLSTVAIDGSTSPLTGNVTATGTASHWAIVTSGSSRLEAASSLAASQAVTNGNTFTLLSFDIRLPNTGG